MSGAEIGKAKSYLYSIAGNIIKNYYEKKKEILLDQLPDIEKDNLTEIEIRLDVGTVRSTKFIFLPSRLP